MLGLKVVYKAGYHKGKVFEVLSYPFMDPIFGMPVVVIEKGGEFVAEHISKLARYITRNKEKTVCAQETS